MIPILDVYVAETLTAFHERDVQRQVARRQRLRELRRGRDVRAMPVWLQLLTTLFR